MNQRPFVSNPVMTTECLAYYSTDFQMQKVTLFQNSLGEIRKVPFILSLSVLLSRPQLAVQFNIHATLRQQNCWPIFGMNNSADPSVVNWTYWAGMLKMRRWVALQEPGTEQDMISTSCVFVHMCVQEITQTEKEIKMCLNGISLIMHWVCL